MGAPMSNPRSLSFITADPPRRAQGRCPEEFDSSFADIGRRRALEDDHLSHAVRCRCLVPFRFNEGRHRSKHVGPAPLATGSSTTQGTCRKLPPPRRSSRQSIRRSARLIPRSRFFIEGNPPRLFGEDPDDSTRSSSIISQFVYPPSAAGSGGGESLEKGAQPVLSDVASMTGLSRRRRHTNAACPAGSFAVTCNDGLTEIDSQQQILSNQVCLPPAPFTQSYCDFSSLGGLQINGDAAQSGSELRLAPNTTYQAGTSFVQTPMTLDETTSFHSSFSFQIAPNANGADGMAFVIQSQSAQSVGANGGGIGYGGVAGSVVVEFDIWQNNYDPNANHVGIMVNGDETTHLAVGTPSFNMAGGGVLNAWVDYDAGPHCMR